MIAVTFLLAPPTTGLAQILGPFVPAPAAARIEPARLPPSVTSAPENLAVLGSAALEAPGALDALNAWNRSGNVPQRNGFTRRLPEPRRLTIDGSRPRTAWSAPDGSVVWKGSVEATGAWALRVHLTRVHLPTDTWLWFTGASGQTEGPLGTDAATAAGDVWSTLLAGPRVEVTVEMRPTAVRAGQAVTFDLEEVVEVFPVGERCDEDPEPRNGSPALGDLARNSTARLDFVRDGSSYMCSGGLVNSAGDTSALYLLAAGPCLTSALLDSLLASFGAPAASCSPLAAGLSRTSGATFLAGGEVALAALHGRLPRPAFLGWDARTGRLDAAGPPRAPDSPLLTRDGYVVDAAFAASFPSLRHWLLDCSYSIPATPLRAASTGGASSFSVLTGPGCYWTAKSNVPWISVTGGFSGTGNGGVFYSVEPNQSGVNRTGTFTVADQTVELIQTAFCVTALSPMGGSVPPGGGSGSFDVETLGACSWTAASDSAWLSVRPDFGTERVSYTAAPNTSNTQRTGTVTVSEPPASAHPRNGDPALLPPPPLEFLFPVLQDPCQPVSAAVSGTATICAGGSAVIQAILFGQSPWKVVWSDGLVQEGLTDYMLRRTVTPDSTSVYRLTSVSDASGCPGTTSGSANVTVVPLPARPVITAPPSANEGQFDLFASVVPQAGNTYTWTIANGTITAGQGTSQITFTAGTAGAVSLSVVQRTATGCASPPGSKSVPVTATKFLVLSNAAIHVAVAWRSPYDGRSGDAYGLVQRGDFGYFYFDDPQNPEVFVKALDYGFELPYLVFHAGLTDFDYTVTFTVSATGQFVTFHKPAGTYGAGADTTTLRHGGGPGGFGRPREAGTSAARPEATPGPIDLSAGHVRVKVDWKSPYSGKSGTAYPVPQADGFAFFYFTDPAVPEVFVKALDFGADHPYLAFWGGLSDYELTITFTVLRTSQTLIFHKSAYGLSAGADGVTLAH